VIRVKHFPNPFFPILHIPLAFVLGVTCSFKTPVDFQRTTWRYIPGDKSLYKHSCENLKSYMIQIYVTNFSDLGHVHKSVSNMKCSLRKTITLDLIFVQNVYLLRLENNNTGYPDEKYPKYKISISETNCHTLI
jgi:hypothetical protein